MVSFYTPLKNRKLLVFWYYGERGKEIKNSLKLKVVLKTSADSNLIKKRLWHRSFPLNLAELFITGSLQKTSRRLFLKSRQEMNFRLKMKKLPTCQLEELFSKTTVFKISEMSGMSRECQVDQNDCFHWTYFTPFPCISIVDFEQL